MAEIRVAEKMWPDAVQSLQHAIRGYPTCPDLWEALGLAYQRLGMFSAALKSYGRASELDNTRVFALLGSGNILMLLSSYRKAVDMFREAAKIAPQNVSAHYGLASALLGMSRDCINSGAFWWGASLLEEASVITRGCCHTAGNMSPLWKLLGDIEMTYAKCSPWSQENGCCEIDEAAFAASILTWKEKCQLAAVTANRAYQKTLHLTPWQANMYADVAISLDYICSLKQLKPNDGTDRQLAEKMSLGGLVLECSNSEFWIALGCLANYGALQQHALIRGLQLCVSHAASWSYLGKLFHKEGHVVISKQTLDRARSLDPSLPLPWAAMLTNSSAGDISWDEAFENCLHSVRLLPVVEFQLGLAKLAFISGHLQSSQVFVAITQAVQRAPHYPEGHNLYGLVCEARSDYCSAIAAYRRARFAANVSTVATPSSCKHDITANLSRALCVAGHFLDGTRECKVLEEEGFLDNRGLLIYAVALWELGKTDRALSIAKHLTASVSYSDLKTAADVFGLICKLLYHIVGMKYTWPVILKKKDTLLQRSRNVFLIASVKALNTSEHLETFFSSGIESLLSHEEASKLHSLIAMAKWLSCGSNREVGISCAKKHLKRSLHIYPHSVSIRNQLSSLLIWDKNWKAAHCVSNCTGMGTSMYLTSKLSEPSYENLGSAAVSCYSSCSRNTSFSTCEDRHTCRVKPTHLLQKWCHQQPWNHKPKYLIIVTFYQEARERKFPRHICYMLKRLLMSAFASETSAGNCETYQKLMLLLCASELCLQCGDYSGCLHYATDASQLSLPNGVLFFSHFQLCRAYSSVGDLGALQVEYQKCLQIGTCYEIGWLLLKFLECTFKLKSGSNTIDMNFEACLKEKGSCWYRWMALFNLVDIQIFISDQEFLLAEALLRRVCSHQVDACLLFLHGVVCMEVARKQSDSNFLSLAVKSLSKAREMKVFPLPIVSVMLAQAHASVGAKSNWERDLRLEWYSWPAENRPVELYFLMYLVARQSKEASEIESSQAPVKWFLHAIHLNPSCLRYWKVLQKVKGQP
ncbi:tetratricopeptide repeat protein SKI3 isoform X2 [Nymphaea colorata]|uniref:tetratricopeptide repeat protein SKI3 isoform X2 n=1 Tax=Nymphaea colorata TaxID=210225 RepID=UPI00129DDCD1|nr:tetratricopeptide repeat protein SKI3 isoform X2 [Nymphaea colorata]